MSAHGELYTIVEDAKTELREWCEENSKSDPTDDAIREIADSSTPVYTRDIMEMGMQNEDLACTIPDLGSDGSPVEAMKIVIYEYIEQSLNEEWRVIEQEREEAELEEDEEDEPEEDDEEDSDDPEEEDAKANPEEL